MFSDIEEDLDNETFEWYKTADKPNKIAALTVGKSVVTSNNYCNDKDVFVCKLEDELNELKSELALSNVRYEDEQRKQDEKCREIREQERIKYNKLLEATDAERCKLEEKCNMINNDNSKAIEVGINVGSKYLTELNDRLNSEICDLKSHLSISNSQLDELKCNMKTSKKKGDMAESEVSKYIEENGFKVEKPGIHSGDLFVYSREEPENVICILEIKNYGEDNKSKLGPEGCQSSKMYNDIENVLKKDLNVPWIFISLGCEIPKIGEMRSYHLGVRCIYLELPSIKELITHIIFCEELNKVNKRKNDSNTIYIQQKIIEMNEIFTRLKETKPNFKVIKEEFEKGLKKLDKEESKYNKILDDTINRVGNITKDLNWSSDNIIYNKNVDEIACGNLKGYIEELQRECIRLEVLSKNNLIKTENISDTTDLSDTTNLSDIVDNTNTTNKRKKRGRPKTKSKDRSKSRAVENSVNFL